MIKKNESSALHCKKVKSDCKKQYIKKVRFFPVCMFSHRDRWLKMMSKKGWHIVRYGTLLYEFERGCPCEREYFSYGVFTQEGKYNILLRYPFLEKTYGAKKKSRLNSSWIAAYRIIEIDINKIDIQENVGYRELVKERNELYIKYCFRNFAILLSIFILLLLSYFVFR